MRKAARMRIENVGLMTPGDMGQAVALQIKARGFTVSTALEGRSDRSHALAREAHHVFLADGVRRGLPWFDSAAGESLRLVRYDEGVIDPDRAPEAATGVARADR